MPPRTGGDRSVLNTTKPLPSSIARVRCAIITESIYNGGAERWMEDLVTLTDPDLVEWVGIGASDKVVSTIAAHRLERVVPLFVGWEETQKLTSCTDLLIAWPHLTTFHLPETRPAIWVSHSGPESKWGVNHARHEKKGFTKHVAVSRDAVRSYNSDMWGDVSVIQNAVNMDRLAPGMGSRNFRAKHGIPAGGKVIGYLGRLSPEKGFESFMRSAVHLPQSWTLAVGGEAYYDSNIQKARSLTGSRVVMLGEVEDIGEFLSAIDLLVVPSEYESFGYSIVEAMAAGVPVVSTCVGVVKDHPTMARLIPLPASPSAIAMAIIEDLCDRDGTDARVNRALATIPDAYSAKRFGKSWTEMIVQQARTAQPLLTPQRPTECSVESPVTVRSV